MAKVKEGDKAPDFKVIASDELEVSLKKFKGKRIVLYFYPKDDTPGCTKEACAFRDSHRKIQNQDTVVLGVSPDGVAKHNKFIEKYKLPFLLLADEDKKICKAYGTWVKKSMYGREYMGVQRSTFIIGKTGKIEKIYDKVKPVEHAEEVLAYLKESK